MMSPEHKVLVVRVHRWMTISTQQVCQQHLLLQGHDKNPVVRGTTNILINME